MSIIEVANIAGVSKSTVSRVINDLPGVAPEATAAVRRAMGQLGYRPSARRPGPKPANRQGIKTGNVALLSIGRNSSDLYTLPVLPAMLHGVERCLAEQGLNLMVASLSPGGPIPAILSSGQADGLLLFGKWEAMPTDIRRLLLNHVGVWVLREHSDPLGEFDHVFYDNAAVGHLAARYLLERGHKRVGFVNARPGHNAFAHRGREFVAAVNQAGGDVQAFVAPGEAEHADPIAYEALLGKMLDGKNRPTGLFVPADRELAGVCRALESRGLQLGKDLDVISCDNEQQYLASLKVRPATIDINLDLVGRRGVQQLLWRMQNPEEKNRIDVLVKPRLVSADEIVISG